MKIVILYKMKDGAWGGGNQFLKACKKQWEAKDRYANELEDADIVLYDSYQHLVDALKAKKQYPNKVFVHRLGPIFYYHRGWWWKYMDKLVLRIAPAIADMTIFQSTWTKDQSIALGFDSDESYAVIQNTPDKDIFYPDTEKQFDPKNVTLVASSWSANKNKGFDVYKHLDEQLDFTQYNMHFVGKSPYSFSHIDIQGPFSSDELAARLRQADIFVTATKHDACSNSLIEALASGLPCAILDSGGNAELVKGAGETFTGKEDVMKAIENIVDQYVEYRGAIDVPEIEDIANEYYDAAMRVSEGKPKSLSTIAYIWFRLQIFGFGILNKVFNNVFR